MKLSVITTAWLFSSLALGARFTERRRARLAQRRAVGNQRTGHSGPRLPADDVLQTSELTNGSANVQYSSNWAGAVLISTGYKSVTGTFVVPTPKTPTGGSSSTEYAASAWVGIDGDTAQNSILQTGVDFYIQGGKASFDCWYEWYPDYAYTFSGISISAGDTITVTVTASSTSAGTAVVENVSTGKSVSHTFRSETNKLEELNAEWIVEDFEESGSLVPFANFGTVTFTDAYATNSSGTFGPAGAELIDIKQSGTVYTTSSVSGGEVTVAYSA